MGDMQGRMAGYGDEDWEHEDGAEVRAATTTENVLTRPISECDFSVRCHSHLRDAKIVVVADLCRRSRDDLVRTHCFSRRSMREIEVVLGDLGLRLGMTAEELGGGNG